MKYIRKAACPRLYSQWCYRVAGTAKADYREIPASEKHALLNGLISEQGALCAYTMRRIDDNSAHVEHIKPQSLCRTEAAESDLSYDNLVACYPRNGMSTNCRYGAQKKGNWWKDDGARFVSPLQSNCERYFYFGLDGNVQAVRNQVAAATTIDVLALDHKSLAEDRKRVIQEFIYGATGDAPLSIASAQRAQRTVSTRTKSGSFYEFCIAIKDALEQHLTILRKLAQRRIARRTS